MSACSVCGLPSEDHTNEMLNNCNIFDIRSEFSANAVPRISEAETAPDDSAHPPRDRPESSGASSPHGFGVDVPDERCSPNETVPPTALTALSLQASEREGSEPRRTRGESSSGISVASVLLGWCNDIKRELEEFANDGPVGPMVPYRLEPNVIEQDLWPLYWSIDDLMRALGSMRDDVTEAARLARARPRVS